MAEATATDTANDTTVTAETLTAPRQPAWHRINGVNRYNTADAPPVSSLTQVYQDLDLDFNVTNEPLYVKVNDTFFPYEGKTAIVREGIYNDGLDEQGQRTWKRAPEVYGLTGKRYRPLINRDIAQLLNPLLSTLELDAVAPLANGRDLLTVFKAEDFEINGEPMQEYVWVHESKSGADAMTFRIVPMRLYCTNQLVTGLKGASFNAGIKHGDNVHGDVAFHINVFDLLAQARKRLRTSFEELAKVNLTSEQVIEAIERIFPNPILPDKLRILQTIAQTSEVTDGDFDAHLRERLDENQVQSLANAQYEYENAMQRLPVQRNDALMLVERFNDLHSNLANTPWGVYNAVTEMMDHGGQDRGDAMARSAMFGDRANTKVRAFGVATSFTDGTWDNDGEYRAGLLKTGRTYSPRAVSSPRGTRTPRPGRPEPTAEELQAAELARENARLERGAARYNAAVTEGKREPTLDAEGIVVLWTAASYQAHEVQVATDRETRQQEALARTQALVQRKNMSIQERINLRNKQIEERRAKRNSALSEEADTNAEAGQIEAGTTAEVDPEAVDD